MKRIAVVGASGLVGSTLTERLLARGTDEVVPFIHSSGNAMRLARHGIELKMLDLMDPSQVDAALAGCTHVVNCSRGGDDVMLNGLRHLLASAKRNRVRKVVHLGSVAVYGDPPPPETATEQGPTRPAKGSYGWVKLQQDGLVAAAARDGVPAVVLCPPNISGPYSYYLVALVEALRRGAFALLEEGSGPCNLVDVANLCHAIELALDRGPADGTRMFVTDDSSATWSSVVDALLPLAQPADRPARVTRAELGSRTRPAVEHRPSSVLRSVKHLVSSDVRAALRRDPIWEKVDGAMRRLVTKAGSRVEGRLRLSVEGPLRVAKHSPLPAWATPLCGQQLRDVRHSCALAKSALGYAPLYTADQSMQAFSRWYRTTQGMGTTVWPLLRQLQ